MMKIVHPQFSFSLPGSVNFNKALTDHILEIYL